MLKKNKDKIKKYLFGSFNKSPIKLTNLNLFYLNFFLNLLCCKKYPVAQLKVHKILCKKSRILYGFNMIVKNSRSVK